ncbi:MAG: LacI family DNA-binding transcriptional regulator [Chloroflexi bacterium]|nr:LacI family DNA-binding transcriptional regulator [Chloroflexota bacterium]
MSTITEVARLAQVSVSTVSHVVNGTRPVSDATRARVMDAIAASGYSPNLGARALRRARTDSIGLIVSDTGQPVFADMIRGVEHEARAAGFTLLLANSAEDRELERASVRALRERRVDGLLLAQVSGSDARLVESITDDALPLVLIDRLSSPGVDQVGVENAAPMRALVRHLLELGHRRIALVGGDPVVPTIAERHRGFVEAFAEAGVELDPDLLLTAEGVHQDQSRAAVRRVLRRADRPSALVGAGMVLSMGALQAVGDVGLSIPNDIAFVTFDEPAYADVFRPRLTSAVQPAFDVGRQGMRLLLRRIRQRDAEVRTVRLMPRIVHRESCGCPPGTATELEVDA